MGVDLIRGDERTYVNWFGWARVCAFAIEGGWKPLGTLPPDYFSEEKKANWSGTYNSNDYQIITSEDALSMALALEKMLHTFGEEVETADRVTSLSSDYDQLRDFITKEGNREGLEALIDFLKGGDCEIA